MDRDEEPVVASNENAHHILEWQLYTYHHIQSLATGILGAVFSGLAIVITILTAYRKSIPSIPWAEIESQSEHILFNGFALSPSFTQAEVAVTWVMSGFGLVLAASVLAEGVYFFGVIVLGDRLSHLANTDDISIVSLPKKTIDNLPVSDYVANSRSEWMVSNADITQQADSLLRHGLYRLPIALFLALYYVYIYLVSVQVDLGAILLNQLNTVSLSIFIAYGLRKRDLEGRIARPTTWIWIVQVIFAVIGMGLFVSGVQ